MVSRNSKFATMEDKMVVVTLVPQQLDRSYRSLPQLEVSFAGKGLDDVAKGVFGWRFAIIVICVLHLGMLVALHDPWVEQNWPQLELDLNRNNPDLKRHFECLESRAAVDKEVHFYRSPLRQHRTDPNILGISELMALPYNYSTEEDNVE